MTVILLLAAAILKARWQARNDTWYPDDIIWLKYITRYDHLVDSNTRTKHRAKAHYKGKGQFYGLKLESANSCSEFDWKQYIRMYPDISTTLTTQFDTLKYFITMGRVEGHKVPIDWAKRIDCYKSSAKSVEYSMYGNASIILNHSFLLEKEIQKQRRAYVTFLASDNYVPALEVFLYTFVASSSSYPIILTIPENADTSSQLFQTAAKIFGKYPHLSYQIYHLPEIRSSCTVGRCERENWSRNWAKLGMWTLTQYTSLFYIDLDVIFLRNVDAAFDMLDTAQVDFLGTMDYSKHTAISEHKLNGGVFIFRPSRKTFEELVLLKQQREMYNALEAEQGLFNWRYFSEKYCCLPPHFNTQKTMAQAYQSIWDIQRIHVLHFTGEKPWFSWSSTLFRQKYVANKKQYEKLESWDAHEYPHLHDLWRSKYIEARRDEFQRFTMYQMYHDKKCFVGLNLSPFYKHVRLNGPLHSEQDIDAVKLFPELADPNYQKYLGEFGGMLALLNMKDELPDFVGITSWKQSEKANYKEGASIDWTKVDFRNDTVYFWYGIHSPNSFYEEMDKHHNGLKRVMEGVVDHPLPPMGPGFYAYGNYVIMHKTLFIEFMNSAKNVLQKYMQQCGTKSVSDTTYKFENTDSCAFAIGIEPESRRPGYLLERYVNIWAAQRRIRFNYAVDNPSWRMTS